MFAAQGLWRMWQLQTINKMEIYLHFFWLLYPYSWTDSLSPRPSLRRKVSGCCRPGRCPPEELLGDDIYSVAVNMPRMPVKWPRQALCRAGCAVAAGWTQVGWRHGPVPHPGCGPSSAGARGPFRGATMVVPAPQGAPTALCPHALVV